MYAGLHWSQRGHPSVSLMTSSVVPPGCVQSPTGCPDVTPPWPVQPGAHLPHDPSVPGQGCAGGSSESGCS